MTILSDNQIAERCDGVNPMIKPFIAQSVREVESEIIPGKMRKILSYGSSSFGYDVRLRSEGVQIFNKDYTKVLDPKRPDSECMLDAKVFTDEDGAEFVILPPNNYMLAATIEEFEIPEDVMVVCLGKSTYARMATICNTTPVEAGFIGNVVIEIANATPLPCKIYLNEGIAQFLFFKGSEACGVSYSQRNGKYMYQGMGDAPVLTHSRV